MGEVAKLVSGFNRHLMTGFFVIGTLLPQVFVPYHRYIFAGLQSLSLGTPANVSKPASPKPRVP